MAAEVSDGVQQLVRSTFQVADLTRPLMSVSQICAQGHRCIFEKDYAQVVTAEGEVICKFRRDNGLYVATMKLKAPSPFGRQEP